MGVELCPVQVRHYEFKCQNSDFDEEKMLGEPHMRGIKRKFSAENEKMFSDILYSQRQTLFNLTMCKLTRFRQNPEPSLRRSVLIFNTLRNMERDMDKDCLRINCCFNGPLSTQNGNSNHQLISTPSKSEDSQNSSFTNYNSSLSMPVTNVSPFDESYFYNNNCLPNNLNSSLCTSDSETKCKPLVELDCLSSGRITPFTRSVYDRVDAGASWNDDTDRLTSLNWSSVLNFNFSSNSQAQSNSVINTNGDSNKNGSDTSEISLHTLMPPSQGSVSLTTLSNCANPLLNNGNVIGSITTLNNGTEEIFGDIDLSLYDFDVLSPLSPPNVKLAPVTAEELMKSIAGSSESNSNQPDDKELSSKT